jgi:hypothetical protein
MKEWLYPLHYEKRYSSYLEKSLTAAKKEFLARLQTLPEWNSEAIDLFIVQMNDWIAKKREENKRILFGYFSLINSFNDKQFRAVVKDGTGLTLPNPNSSELASPYSDLLSKFGDNADIFRQEPYLLEIQQTWVSIQDTQLDKTITSTVIDLSQIVKQSILSQVAKKIILGAINSRVEVESKRIVSFGKDQVSKINIQLERAKAGSLNLDSYEWITRRDERVRGNPNGIYPKAKPSHFAREGKLFNWTNPPEGGHPGEAPGCRCKARLRFRK